MKGRPTEKLVYEQMFPKPKPNDPQSFQTFLTRNLIPEVRQETQAFYGHLDTQEAKYPGLDYTHPTHRIRLSRWPWHRRLFRAFDAIELTKSEITGLTRWEGTKWAKEKYESEHNVIIKDTTGDEIPDWDEACAGLVRHRVSRDSGARDVEGDEEEQEDENMNEAESDNQSEGDQLESVGIELNERLRAGAARREAGDTSVVLDEEWEQWLKNAIETGLLHNMSEQSFRQMFELSVVNPSLIPASMMSAARAGHWSEVPEFLHPLIRASFHHEAIVNRSSVTGRASNSPDYIDYHDVTGRSVDSPPHSIIRNSRQTYSNLRLPAGGRGPNTPGAV
jgi:hypothetical protein